MTAKPTNLVSSSNNQASSSLKLYRFLNCYMNSRRIVLSQLSIILRTKGTHPKM